jgi:hypothetical protein
MDFDEAFNYFLGPTGIPQRVAAVNQMFNPVESVGRSMQSSQEMLAPNKTPMQRAASGAEMLTGVAEAVMPMAAAARPAAAVSRVSKMRGGMPDAQVPVGRAVVRPDNVFRGAGSEGVSYRSADASGKYAIRMTDAKQIEDMISSGTVRPKPGGYGQDGKATLYFGLVDNPTVKTGPFGINATKTHALVGDPENVAAYGSRVPMDALKHVWTTGADGQPVDILGDLLAQNLARAGK